MKKKAADTSQAAVSSEKSPAKEPAKTAAPPKKAPAEKPVKTAGDMRKTLEKRQKQLKHITTLVQVSIRIINAFSRSRPIYRK